MLKYNLHITLEVEIWHLGSTHKIYVKTGSFGWFSLVHFWFGLVGFVFLTLTAVLGGNSTWGSNYQMFWDEITFSSLTLLRSSSRLTVSAWVSPSSTPACLDLVLLKKRIMSERFWFFTLKMTLQALRNVDFPDR